MAAPVTIDFGGDASPLVREIQRIKNEIKNLDSSSATFNQDYKRLMGESTLATRQFNAELKASKQNTSGFNDSLSSIKGITATSLGLDIFSRLSGLVSEAIGKFHELNAAADDLADTASSLNIPLDQFDGLALAASNAGVDVDKFTKVVAKLNEFTQTGNPILEKLGINLKGIRADAALLKLADYFASISDKTTAAALATTLFGEKSAAMAGFLNQGSQALATQRDQLSKNAGISEDAAKAAGDLMDANARLSKALDNQMVNALREVNKFLATFKGALADSIQYTDSLSQAVGTFFRSFGASGSGTAKAINSMKADQDSILEAIGSTEKLRDALPGFLKGFAASHIKSLYADYDSYAKNIKGLQKDLEDASNLPKPPDSSGEVKRVLGGLGDTAKKSGAGIKETLSSLDEFSKRLVAQQTEYDQIASKIEVVNELRAKGAIDDATYATNLKTLTDEQKRHADALQVALTPMQQYRDEILKGADAAKESKAKFSELLSLLQTGKIDQATFDKAAAALGDGASKASAWSAEIKKLREETNATGEKLKWLSQQLDLGQISKEEFDKLANSLQPVTDRLTELKVAFGDILAQGVGGLVDSFFQMDQSFSQAVSNMLKEVGKLIAKMLVLKAIETGLGALGFGKSADAGSLVRTVSVPQTDLAPRSFSVPDFTVPTRQMVAMTAPAPVAVKGQSQGDVKVNIYDQNDSKVEVKKSKKQNGTQEIDIYIKQRVTSMMNDGSLDKTFRTRYGLSPNPI